MPLSSTIRQVEIFMIALQGFQVLFLWVHDWVPLGSLNGVAAIRRADSRQRLVVVTLIQSAPFTVGLLFSMLDFGQPYPIGSILGFGLAMAFSCWGRYVPGGYPT